MASSSSKQDLLNRITKLEKQKSELEVQLKKVNTSLSDARHLLHQICSSHDQKVSSGWDIRPSGSRSGWDIRPSGSRSGWDIRPSEYDKNRLDIREPSELYQNRSRSGRGNREHDRGRGDLGSNPSSHTWNREHDPRSRSGRDIREPSERVFHSEHDRWSRERDPHSRSGWEIREPSERDRRSRERDPHSRSGREIREPSERDRRSRDRVSECDRDQRLKRSRSPSKRSRSRSRPTSNSRSTIQLLKLKTFPPRLSEELPDNSPSYNPKSVSPRQRVFIPRRQSL